MNKSSMNIPTALLNAIQELSLKQYEELYEVNQFNGGENNNLETDVKHILNLLKGETNEITYSRYLWMGLLMGFAVKPTIISHLPNDVRPSLILKRVKGLFFREQSKYLCYKFDLVPDDEDYAYNISQFEEHLFPHKCEGSQALDEALDVFCNLLGMMDTQLAKEALLKILDDCFDGYAIFPGSQYKRELFNWWLLDVVPSSWYLRFPIQIYTVNGLTEFTPEHFLEL